MLGALATRPELAEESPTVPLPITAAPAEAQRAGVGTRVGTAIRGRAGSAVRRWVPEGWRGARLDPGRPGAVALTLVTAIAAIVAAVGVWVGRPRPEPVPALPAAGLVTVSPDPTGAAAPASADAAAPLVVSVVGKVVRPGLVRVPEGSRVADVIEVAGGPLPGADLTATNLARRVVDGEQIAVGVPGAPDGGGGAQGAGRPAARGKIDLNRATVEQLDGLPGVGPVTASRIVEWRTRNGRFSRVEQLREIEGIGARRFGQLRDLVTV
ncbi:competence protein ComEA [Pseudonocardia asaccharolytica DSM 44247 = NBRC 16224]|uniref:Competence protein ComEA n=1 Tax=Pseudonocardia asaccharolytica DSM 44247 = NBRC 16224 TaxID=1123024 RepID=A0A511CX64_9PSEU|nr:competence protein ComEA [Pseudonocardia asaccharolytica DSM 44247 = NBRC 16224]